MNSMFTIVILALLATATLVQGRLSIPSTKVQRHAKQLSESNRKLMQAEASKFIEKDVRNKKLRNELNGSQNYGMSQYSTGLLDYSNFVPDKFKELLKDTIMKDEAVAIAIP
eukprot:scaffold3310_cov283-Chaetoceros_neogracile.AAC.29